MRSHHPLPFPKISLPVFLPLFFSLFTLLPTTGFTTTLISDTCRRCSDADPNLSYNFCTAALESSPDSPHLHCCSNLRQLGLHSFKLTKQNVTSTRTFIKRLLKNKETKLDPYVKACLGDCMELYTGALLSIKDAVKKYKSKEYDDANIALSSVTDASTTCEDGFKEKENVVSPLTKRNSDTFQLTVISLSIINILN